MRLTSITIPWADGEFTFNLRLGEIRNLQEKTGVGPPVVLHRLRNELWMLDDYRETILQGLLGGGMKAEEARTLIKKWVEGRPASESILTAVQILGAFIYGVPEKKAKAVKKTTEAAMAPAASTSPPSTEQAPQSVSPPET